MSKLKLNQLMYRMRVRKNLGNLDIELLKITKEECDREIERRNKKK